MKNTFRVFATCDIGPALDVLRRRGYQLEVYPDPKAPPKSLILDKLRSGIDGLITTLRDQVDVLAAAHGVPASVLADVAVPLVAHLVERGILRPA